MASFHQTRRRFQSREERRFDWLYERLVTTGRLKSLLSKTLDLPEVFWHRLSSETNHEKRAALICLLTAAVADKGTAAVIGEAEGGWFWLPRRGRCGNRGRKKVLRVPQKGWP